VEQQVSRRRKKRDDYNEPSDPKFPQQWYLVSKVVIIIIHLFYIALFFIPESISKALSERLKSDPP
jgi:hypothetical protein